MRISGHQPHSGKIHPAKPTQYIAGHGNGPDAADQLFEELRDEFELETDWEEIQRDSHLAVAYADAGVLDDQGAPSDSRVIPYVERHNPN